MLIPKIQQQVEIGDIAVFRLTSGEELIGKVTSHSADAITLTKPIVIQMQMVGPQQADVGIAPFMIGAEEDGNFTFPKTALTVVPIKARAEIVNTYLRATSPIEIPQTSGLLVPKG